MVAIKLDGHGVTIYRDDVDDWLRCDPSDFRAACCRDLGLIDPGANADEFCRRLMAEKTRRDAGHASEVLAAASRRLA